VIRTTPEGAFVWFQLDVRTDHKITWPLELYIAYAKTSKDEPELRCQLWNAGEISPLTEREKAELAAASFRLDKSKIEWERTAWQAKQAALLKGPIKAAVA
jgi:hypothetical protein